MIEWYSGINNYRKHTFEVGSEGNIFTTELLDVETQQFNTVQEAIAYNLSGANLPVEVLYSGGVDSEWVLLSCLMHKIPVVAVTMRLLYYGSPVNIADLYYSEKFCREHGVKHRIIDLDINSFFENGDHIPLMEPYKFTMYSAGTLLWLITQCESYPVIGGDYTWPQYENKVYSPHRYDYNAFELFMKDHGITGIGNTLSYSLESNSMLIKEHLNVHLADPENTHGDWMTIRVLKERMSKNLGFNVETRHRSYGWEAVLMSQHYFHIKHYTDALIEKYGKTDSQIRWGNTLAVLLDATPGENDCYKIDPDRTSEYHLTVPEEFIPKHVQSAHT